MGIFRKNDGGLFGGGGSNLSQNPRLISILSIISPRFRDFLATPAGATWLNASSARDYDAENEVFLGNVAASNQAGADIVTNDLGIGGPRVRIREG